VTSSAQHDVLPRAAAGFRLVHTLIAEVDLAGLG
jgi:hypothetical protein